MDRLSASLTIIRNALARVKPECSMPHTKIVEDVIKQLVKKGFVESYRVDTVGTIKTIIVVLKYRNGSIPVITSIQRVSKPGVRIYKGYSEIKKVLGGKGIAIVSTSKGIMTDESARALKVGGEVICEVY